jgi:hypothetical protein
MVPKNQHYSNVSTPKPPLCHRLGWTNVLLSHVCRMFQSNHRMSTLAIFQACDIIGGDIKEEHGILPTEPAAETVKSEAACTIAFMESGAGE